MVSTNQRSLTHAAQLPALLDGRGFTLMEVLVALGILSTLMALVSLSFMTNLKSNLNTQLRYEAIQAAQDVLDEIRFLDISTLAAPMTENITIGTRTYAVAVTYCTNPDFCISDDIRHVSLSVSYKSKLLYATDTVYTKL